MNIGDRVCMSRDGSVGIVESVEDSGWPCADVRWLTPRNVPSCCVGLCAQADLTIVPDSVVPQPRSKAWWRKSREFCAVIENVLRSEGGK